MILVLPYPEYFPSQLPKTVVGVSIPEFVALYLLAPPASIVVGQSTSMDRATMPEATIDEHGEASSRKCNIDGATAAGHGSIVNPEPVAELMESRPEALLIRIV